MARRDQVEDTGADVSFLVPDPLCHVSEQPPLLTSGDWPDLPLVEDIPRPSRGTVLRRASFQRPVDPHEAQPSTPPAEDEIC